MITLNVGDAHLEFDQASRIMKFKGSMRLANMLEYQPVDAFLRKNTESVEDVVIFDFSDLQFLNSSGITTLSLFLLQCKKKGNMKLKIIGSDAVSWQQKSLANFKKLWNEIDLEM